MDRKLDVFSYSATRPHFTILYHTVRLHSYTTTPPRELGKEGANSLGYFGIRHIGSFFFFFFV